MKNKHKEYLIKKSKTTRISFKKSGVEVYHQYIDPTTGLVYKDEGWWDDCAIYERGRRCAIFWVHPRMRYVDKCDDIAMGIADKEFPRKGSLKSWFNKATPNFKKLGKSRKKAVSWTMGKLEDDGYFDSWTKNKSLVLNDDNNGVVVKPSIKLEIGGRSRLVEVCFPIEVIDETSLKCMAEIVRKYIKDPGSFKEDWSDYEYTIENWKQEKFDKTNY